MRITARARRWPSSVWRRRRPGTLIASGSGDCRAFTTGYKFQLQDYHREDMNQSYVLTEIQHQATVGGSYTTGESEGENYSNHFTCIPASVQFRAGAHHAQAVRAGAADRDGRGPKW